MCTRGTPAPPFRLQGRVDICLLRKSGSPCFPPRSDTCPEHTPHTQATLVEKRLRLCGTCPRHKRGTPSDPGCPGTGPASNFHSLFGQHCFGMCLARSCCTQPAPSSRHWPPCETCPPHRRCTWSVRQHSGTSRFRRRHKLVVPLCSGNGPWRSLGNLSGLSHP